LLHTWSLSVEEQFYILFPIFLLIIFKYFQKHILKILLLFFLTSLSVAHILANTSLYQLFNFYLLPSRIFELLIGSLLSYFELRNKEVGGAYRKSYSILHTLYPSVGFILILYSFLSSFFNFKIISHPSMITLIPLMGASLIIWFSKKGEIITEILSSKIFVFFGLISYSLYLWHYPIFAFLRYFEIFEKSIIVKLCAILLTILMSVFSYYFIERPFRKKNIISLKTLTIYILISATILLSYSVYILNTEGIKKRYNNIFTEKLTYNIKSNEFYKINSTDNKIYLIGDSHANSLSYYLNQVSRNLSYSFYNNYTHLYLHDFNQIYRKNNNIENSYFETNERIDKFLSENKNLVVVWNQRWVIKIVENYIFPNEKTGFYFEPINRKNSTLEERQTYIAEAIKSSIKYILDKGHILILVYPIPENNFNPVIKLGMNNMWYLFNNKKKQIEIYSTDYLIYKRRNKIIFDILDSVQSPNIFRIYPDKFFCNTLIVNRCIANNKESIFYSDDNHLSLNGSKYITNSIEKIVKEINYFDKK